MQSFENKLQLAGFKLISNENKIIIQCNNCSKIKIISKRYIGGCRYCNRGKLLSKKNSIYTKEYIIKKCKDKNYSVMEIIENKKIQNIDYINLRNTLIKLKCNDCLTEKTISYFPSFIKSANCNICRYKLISENSKNQFLSFCTDKFIVIDFKDMQSDFSLKCKLCNKIKQYQNAYTVRKTNNCEYCNSKRKLSIDNVKNSCIKHEIYYLDDFYRNAHEKHNFKCFAGHYFTSSINKIVYSQQNCKICYGEYLINESYVGKFLKNNQIDHKRHYRLKIDNDKYLVIDYFLLSENIFIEYNGLQHYEPVCFGSKTKENAQVCFEKQLERDQFLRNYCKLNAIKLIEIDGRVYTNKKIFTYLETQFLLT